MNKLVFIFALLFSLSGLASVELKVGDILLQPLKCWSCSLIEAEEETPYSHAGVVIAVEPEIIVAEALNTVRLLPLATFQARNKNIGKLSVRRLTNSKAVAYMQENQGKLLSMYQSWFHGAKYDHAFLWNNLDADGYEMFYCTEFITKLYQGFLGVELPVKYMHFQKNRDQWMKFFKGTPPDGKIGNSPGDFQRAENLYEVGEI